MRSVRQTPGPLVHFSWKRLEVPKLRAWQRLDALASLGASLIAASPHTPDNSLSTAQRNELVYPVLRDSDLAPANAFGVASWMPPDLVDDYSRVGNNLPRLHGNGRWVLPVPAAYVVGRGGCIVYAHVEADYRERAEPSDALIAVRRASQALRL